MLEVFSSQGASLHQLNSLAEWVREHVAKVEEGHLDVIRLVEIDLPHFFPGLYVEIESDSRMGKRKAYVSADPFGLVVAESIYNRASDGCLKSAETILHEVGHLFLHDKYKSLGLNDGYGVYREQIKDTNASNSAEWQAKAFAMCILFPYSKFKKYRQRLELQVYFDLSAEQSDRVLLHIQKLRLRDPERSRQMEKRWIDSILANLPKLRRSEKRYISDQLDLFYRNV